MRNVTGHKIRFFAVVNGERTPRTSDMFSGAFGWDATCSCGFDTKTGGAIMARVDEAVIAHKAEAAAALTVAPSTAQVVLDSLTPRGREFMAMVGRRDFDFFDDGIVEHSGNWGEAMAEQFAAATGTSARSVGGIMAALPAKGLWNLVDDDTGTWWSLTALGAEVALLAAAK